MLDADKRRLILARHGEGESIREISRGVSVSVGLVHKVVKEAETSET